LNRAVFKITLLAVLTAALTTACYDYSRVSDFYEECHSLGGMVQETVPGGLFKDSRIDCIVNNEIVYLEGYY